MGKCVPCFTYLTAYTYQVQTASVHFLHPYTRYVLCKILKLEYEPECRVPSPSHLIFMARALAHHACM